MLPIGICLPTFGTSYAQLREDALAAEALGYDSLWLWDHYVSWNDPREPVLECWTSLAGLAEATTSIQLGSLVANVTNRHPGRLAKVIATLHDLAAGRLEVGLGSGGYAAEQATFGIDQGDRATRTARLEEALQVLPALWRGEPVSFSGQHVQLRGAIVAPALEPPPRLIVGGRSAAMARLAGRYAQGFNVQWRFQDDFPTLFAALDAALAERGRDRAGFDLSLHTDWADLMPDPQTALAEWAALGFTRVIALAPSTPARADLEALARRL
jgi:alkanesulfonate monooxygenase SsuD/methylene tetrahydromethanopterin reductase-like flavin-dependent oxidoreductase (luciferase family)